MNLTPRNTLLPVALIGIILLTASFKMWPVLIGLTAGAVVYHLVLSIGLNKWWPY